MKTKLKRPALTFLSVLLCASGLALLPASQTQAGTPLIASGKHCVAWKTKKTLALVKREEPVGMNCSASVKALKVGANYSAEVTVPISAFHSGEKDRDKEVLKILKANISPNLVFKVSPLPASAWQGMLQRGSGAVHGQLYIAGKPYPLGTTIHVQKNGGHIEVSGAIFTKFSELGIKPPEVGPGGSIAKADDYLELHFNFRSDKLLNSGIIPGI